MNRQTEDTLEKIKGFLTEQADIRLGIVFGSLADGVAGRNSDLDIAILGDRPFNAARRMQFIEALANLSGRPVDLVDLKTAGIPVARSAVLGGKVVFSRDDTAYAEQMSRVLIDSADFLPYRNRILKERRDAWTR